MSSPTKPRTALLLADALFDVGLAYQRLRDKRHRKNKKPRKMHFKHASYLAGQSQVLAQLGLSNLFTKIAGNNSLLLRSVFGSKPTPLSAGARLPGPGGAQYLGPIGSRNRPGTPIRSGVGVNAASNVAVPDYAVPQPLSAPIGRR